MTTLTLIPDEEAFDNLLTTLPPTCLAIIYLHAPWAAPCKKMHTFLQTLASTYPATLPPDIVFLSVDAEEVSEVAERYNVQQVPLVVLQRDGKVLEAITGSDGSKVRTAVEKEMRVAGAGAGNGSVPPAQKVTRPAVDDTIQEPATEAHTNGNGAPADQQTPSDPQPQEAEDLTTRLTTLVSAAPVMLFMKGTPSAPQCGFSRQTVALLRERGVRYGFFNILADDEVRQGLKGFSEWPTFPQVYVGGELVGGLDIVSSNPPAEAFG